MAPGTTFSKHRFGDDLLDQRIRHWQALGATAIWDATFEILENWFVLHGLDPKAQRVNRTRVEKRLPPWLGGPANSEE
jgi:hypothetical protein